MKTLFAAAFMLIALSGCNKKQPNLLPKSVLNVIRMDNGMGTCSGTIVSPGVVVTVAHCVPPPPQKIVTPLGELTLSVAPMVIVGDNIPLSPGLVVPYVDGATMHGEVKRNSYPLIDETNGAVFEVQEAWLCGYPLWSNKLRCTRAKHVGNRIFHALFDTAPIPGQSGGGVFDLNGKLIGMISAGTDEGYTEVVSTSGILSKE